MIKSSSCFICFPLQMAAIWIGIQSSDQSRSFKTREQSDVLFSSNHIAAVYCLKEIENLSFVSLKAYLDEAWWCYKVYLTATWCIFMRKFCASVHKHGAEWICVRLILSNFCVFPLLAGDRTTIICVHSFLNTQRTPFRGLCSHIPHPHG